MNIIITMAGLGSRFRKAGYNCPKYMIEAKGKTLFDWSMDSLIDYNKNVNRYVFVVRAEDDASEFIKTHCASYGIHDVKIVELDHMTDGQATTCMLAIEMKYANISGDGHIPCFHADGDHWSFVKLDSNGKAVEVREKKRISDNCTLGAYYFSSAKLYKELYEEYYSDNSHLEKNEKYIAPLYNFMIQKEMNVTISIVDARKVHVLGTPEELKTFLEEN